MYATAIIQAHYFPTNLNSGGTRTR